jgi:hypothetical protein
MCQNIETSVNHFCTLALCDSSDVSLARIYTWVWFPSVRSKFWRFNLKDKETIKKENPTLFVLQGFTSVNLWGSPNNPLELVQIRCMMNRIPYVFLMLFSHLQIQLTDFDPLRSTSFQVDASFGPIEDLPLSQMCDRLMGCFMEAKMIGNDEVLYEIGHRYYNELIEEQNRNKSRN